MANNSAQIDDVTGEVTEFIIKGRRLKVPDSGMPGPPPQHPPVNPNDIKIIMYVKGDCFYFDGNWYC